MTDSKNTSNIPETDAARIVDEAITSRISARAFLPTPVPRETVEHILQVSQRAPSGTNMQPWKAHVMMGESLQKFSDAMVDIYMNSSGEYQHEKPYYPNPLPEPYIGRRRKVGWDLYGLLDITKGDKEKMQKQHARNYRFFDAPVGMILTIDRIMEIGSWLDYGMFLQNIMIAARGHGLHTCPQAAFAPFHQPIRELLSIPESEMVVCGMAIGHIDPDAIENTLVTERAELSEWVTFV